MRFLIVGGDAAGMSAASRAKRNIPGLDVTVFERTQDVSYSACGMPYNLQDPKRSMDDLVVRPAHVFRERQGIDVRLGHEVVHVDPQGHKVLVRGQGGEYEECFDKLLIATGASPIIPDVEGIRQRGVFVLKSLGDGRRIKEFVLNNKCRAAVILGMGYIALEMAEAFRSLGLKVTMVKPRPKLLPWMNETLSDVVLGELQGHGVELIFGEDLKGVGEDGGRLLLRFSSMEIRCDLLLVAVGIRPNSELAKDAGLELGPSGAISVNRQMQTSHPDVYAAGDCADAYHVVTGKKVWIPLALRANRSGYAVADHLSGKEVELQGVAGTAVFKVFDLEVARTGLSLEEAKREGFDPVEEVVSSRS
ncbi:MAG: FAD/NAD(P)-binding oxidoreductase, partial [Desulfatiglandales bacterium]